MAMLWGVCILKNVGHVRMSGELTINHCNKLELIIHNQCKFISKIYPSKYI